MQKRTLVSFDWALKKLLRQKANYAILEGFLSELLRFDVTIQNILDGESNKDAQETKLNRVDILAQDNEKRLYIIELQYSHELEYFHRMLFAISKSTVEYLPEGFDYSQIRKVYHINLLYFQLGQGSDYVYHGTTRFIGIHLGDELQLSPLQKEKFFVKEVFNIFPEYYVIKINNFNDIAKDTLDEWIYFFKNTALPEKYSARGLQLIEKALNVNNLPAPERSAYEAHQKSMESEKNVLNTAKLEGIAEGKAEGRAEGRAEGEKMGVEKVACQMLKDGLSVETISKYTGLAPEIIQSLSC
jgi:predicted transposase/invertase (TIGR01784 family)